MVSSAREYLHRIRGHAYNFLIKTQKITGIDNVYFFKGGAWMFFAQVMFMLSGMILSIAFTHLGTKALLGKYQLILAIAGTLGATYLPGANTALMLAVSRGQEKTFFPVFKQKLKWSLLGTTGLILTACYFQFLKGDGPFALAFLITAIAFPFLYWNTLINSFFAAKGNFRLANYYLIIEKIVSVVAVVAILLIKPEFIFVVLLYYVSLILINVFNYAQFKKKNLLKGGIDGEARKYGHEITWINIIPKALLTFDRLIIPALIGVEALAVYVIAIIIPDTIDGFINLMHTVAFKKFVTLPEEKIISKVLRPWLIVSFIAIVTATIIGIPFAIKLLYGKEYISAIGLAQAYAIILPFSFVWKTFGNWLLAQKRIKEYFYFYNGFFIVNAALLASIIWFTRTLQGAIIARLSAAILFTVISFIYLKRDIFSNRQTHSRS